MPIIVLHFDLECTLNIKTVAHRFRLGELQNSTAFLEIRCYPVSERDCSEPFIVYLK